jgi:hypothetical protein
MDQLSNCTHKPDRQTDKLGTKYQTAHTNQTNRQARDQISNSTHKLDKQTS